MNLNPSNIIPSEEVTLGEKIGEGYFGNVFKGQWQGADVVVKKATEARKLSEKEIEMIHEEIVKLSITQHPHIVNYMGYILEENKIPSIVMEYVDGGSLSSYIRKISLPEKLVILRDVCSGLLYLHKRSPPIIHRDLACRHVLVSRGLQLRGKLTDFGMAKVFRDDEEEYGRTYNRVGPVRWEAPETLRGRKKKYSPESDIYSLGMTIFECLSGDIPFKNLSLFEVAQKVLNGERPKKPLSGRNWSENIWNLIQSCWKEDPEARPSIKEVLVVIEEEIETLKKKNNKDGVDSFDFTDEKKAAASSDFKIPSHEISLNKGIDILLKKENVKDAVFYIEKAAEEGNGLASGFIGLCYKLGVYFCKRDDKKWNMYIEKGCLLNDEQSIALKSFSERYFAHHKDKKVDYFTIFKTLAEKALKGNAQHAMKFAPSITRLGLCYLKGWGVPKDLTKAAEWFEKAAALGDSAGMVNLGLCYFNGWGVPKDRTKAAEWLEKAAALGSSRAKDYLKKYFN